MNLLGLSDDLLLRKTHELAKQEREVTLQVLHHLREVERRSLYAKLSYSSLFVYAVQELKYSEGAAQRRISSMRLLKEIPELESKIESGALSLMALSQAQVFFRQEGSSKEEKRELLYNLENKSKREVEKELVSRSSAPKKFYSEKLRVVSEKHTEIKFLADEEFLKEVEELRGLIAHRAPGASVKETLAFALKQSLKQLRTKAPKENANESLKGEASPPLVAVKVGAKVVEKVAVKMQKTKPSRYIAAEIRRLVWHRDRGQCTFQINGRQCCSTHGLEYDHILPFALGGDNSAENLRLRCKTHNQLAAIESFGHKKMSHFVQRLR